ncbi:MAG: DUF2339 domain-containing protein [Candidatus Moraniibacteriota bacterium]
MLGFIAIVLVVIFYASISARVKKLEDKVLSGTFTDSASPVVNPVSPGASIDAPKTVVQDEILAGTQPVTSLGSKTVDYKMPPEKSSLEKFGAWLADEWPLKVGIFLLILAVGWFVTYAFINDWIGEVGRISLGVLFGIVLLSAGYHRASIHQIQGNALLVLGSTSVLISIISGIGLYHLFPASVALVVAFMLASFMALAAWQQKNVSLGVVTFLMGSIVPMFVFSAVDISVIFLYLFVLTAGTLWITSKTGWNSLNILSLAVVFFYSVAYDSFEGFSDDFMNLIFAFIFILLFYFSNIFTILYKRLANSYDLVVAGGTGLLFLVWMLMIAPKDLLVYLVIFGAFLFAIGAYIIFILTKSKNPVILYAAVALTLLVSATAIEFKGWELTVAYAVEFSLFIMISLYLKSRGEIASRSIETFGIILYVFLMLLSFSNIEKVFSYLNYHNYNLNSYRSNYYGAQVTNINSDLLVLFLLCIMAFVIAIFAMQVFQKNEDKQLNLVRFYGLFGGFYAVMLTWIMTHLIFTDQTFATIASLIVYTVVGVIFYVVGKKNDYGFYKSVGGVLFGIVLIRLFFVEFAGMDIVGKIITFFVVGILLVSTTFIGGKNKSEIIDIN